MVLSRFVLAPVVSVAVLAVACGGADDGAGAFGNPPSDSNITGAADGGANNTGNNLLPVDGDGGTGTPTPDPSATKCATSSVAAKMVPVYLVFVYDRSGSMKDASKWTSCRSGLENFFASPSSAGLSASMTFFPRDASTCGGSVYADPDLHMHALPDAQTFKTLLEGTKPGAEGKGTPTLPAVQGGLTFAKKVKANHTDGKTVMVLVTDGEPNGCSSSPSSVAAELAKDAASIPTYVIGVGTQTTNLNTIAAGGGTSKAMFVQTNSPSEITTDFQHAIEQIKSSTSCDFAMAKPAMGTLDIDAVNVIFTPASGAPKTLPYDKDCKADGWHYDDPSNPTKIQLCQNSCSALRAADGGKIDIEFGCQTLGGVAR